MKIVTWIGATALIVVAALFWLTRRTDLPTPQLEAVSVPAPRKTPPARLTRISMPPADDVVEPILVLPEVEIAPWPTLVRSANACETADIVRVLLEIPETWFTSQEPAARPEAGRDARPWMPYAPEDRELADTRRLEWTKILVREAGTATRDGGFEETQEPPLLRDGEGGKDR